MGGVYLDCYRDFHDFTATIAVLMIHSQESSLAKGVNTCCAMVTTSPPRDGQTQRITLPCSAHPHGVILPPWTMRRSTHYTSICHSEHNGMGSISLLFTENLMLLLAHWMSQMHKSQCVWRKNQIFPCITFCKSFMSQP